MSELVTQNYPPLPTGENDLCANSLSDKQSMAIELLAMGKSFAAVASAIDVARKTLYNWRQDEEFQVALEDRRRELWSSARDRIRALLDSSLDVLERRLSDRFERSRFQAAATLLRISGVGKHISID